eukprot:gene13184-9030_t
MRITGNYTKPNSPQVKLLQAATHPCVSPTTTPSESKKTSANIQPGDICTNLNLSNQATKTRRCPKASPLRADSKVYYINPPQNATHVATPSHTNYQVLYIKPKPTHNTWTLTTHQNNTITDLTTWCPAQPQNIHIKYSSKGRICTPQHTAQIQDHTQAILRKCTNLPHAPETSNNAKNISPALKSHKYQPTNRASPPSIQQLPTCTPSLSAKHTRKTTASIQAYTQTGNNQLSAKTKTTQVTSHQTWQHHNQTSVGNGPPIRNTTPTQLNPPKAQCKRHNAHNHQEPNQTMVVGRNLQALLPLTGPHLHPEIPHPKHPNILSIDHPGNKPVRQTEFKRTPNIALIKAKTPTFGIILNTEPTDHSNLKPPNSIALKVKPNRQAATTIKYAYEENLHSHNPYTKLNHPALKRSKTHPSLQTPRKKESNYHQQNIPVKAQHGNHQTRLYSLSSFTNSQTVSQTNHPKLTTEQSYKLPNITNPNHKYITHINTNHQTVNRNQCSEYTIYTIQSSRIQNNKQPQHKCTTITQKEASKANRSLKELFGNQQRTTCRLKGKHTPTIHGELNSTTRTKHNPGSSNKHTHNSQTHESTTGTGTHPNLVIVTSLTIQTNSKPSSPSPKTKHNKKTNKSALIIRAFQIIKPQTLTEANSSNPQIKISHCYTLNYQVLQVHNCPETLAATMQNHRPYSTIHKQVHTSFAQQFKTEQRKDIYIDRSNYQHDNFNQLFNTHPKSANRALQQAITYTSIIDHKCQTCTKANNHNLKNAANSLYTE